MSRRSVRALLADILERIERIEGYVSGFDREIFVSDQKTVDSVVRNLEVIGEAASRLPAAFRDRHPGIPWRRIVGLRNRVIHAYFDVDLDLVWEIVRTELPELKRRLRELPADAPEDT